VARRGGSRSGPTPSRRVNAGRNDASGEVGHARATARTQRNLRECQRALALPPLPRGEWVASQLQGVATRKTRSRQNERSSKRENERSSKPSRVKTASRQNRRPSKRVSVKMLFSVGFVWAFPCRWPSNAPVRKDRPYTNALWGQEVGANVAAGAVWWVSPHLGLPRAWSLSRRSVRPGRRNAPASCHRRAPASSRPRSPHPCV